MNESFESDAKGAAERLVFHASYEFERQAKLTHWKTAMSDIEHKRVVQARVTHGHIGLVTEDGYRFSFYGLIEVVCPGEKSLYD